MAVYTPHCRSPNTPTGSSATVRGFACSQHRAVAILHGFGIKLFTNSLMVTKLNGGQKLECGGNLISVPSSWLITMRVCNRFHIAACLNGVAQYSGSLVLGWWWWGGFQICGEDGGRMVLLCRYYWYVSSGINCHLPCETSSSAGQWQSFQWRNEWNGNLAIVVRTLYHSRTKTLTMPSLTKCLRAINKIYLYQV